MKKFITLVLRLAQIFVGLVALYSLLMLLLNNEPLRLFKFEESKGTIIKVEEDLKNKNLISVFYIFTINGNTRKEVLKIGKDWFYENVGGDQVVIFYNSFYPKINYINNLKMFKGYYIGLGWGLFMLTIFISIDLFADKEKWAERYGRFLGLK